MTGRPYRAHEVPDDPVHLPELPTGRRWTTVTIEVAAALNPGRWVCTPPIAGRNRTHSTSIAARLRDAGLDATSHGDRVYARTAAP